MSEMVAIIFLFIAAVTLIYIIALILLQLHQIIKEPVIQKRMRKLRKPVQPWVTVLLYSCNNEPLIEPSLKALLRSHYHNFDIVVIKDYSNNSTTALKKGYRKSLKGQVVLSLQAGTIVPASFIKRAVAIKGERKKITVCVKERFYMHSLTAVIQALSGLLWHRNYKVKVSDGKNISAVKKMIRLDFIFVVLLLAIIVISLMVQQPIIVWYSWLIVTSYLFATIWLKEEKVITKIKLSFSAFSALFLLPVASVVMSFSQLRSRIFRI